MPTVGGPCIGPPPPTLKRGISSTSHLLLAQNEPTQGTHEAPRCWEQKDRRMQPRVWGSFKGGIEHPSVRAGGSAPNGTPGKGTFLEYLRKGLNCEAFQSFSLMSFLRTDGFDNASCGRRDDTVLHGKRWNIPCPGWGWTWASLHSLIC